MTENYALSGHAEVIAGNGSPLSLDVFREVCEGAVSGETMGVLRRIENTQRKLLLKAFVRQVLSLVADLPPDFAEAWTLLLEAEDAAPLVVDEVLMFPAVGLWLRRATESVVDGNVDTSAHLGVLHAVAAAAAIRAGLDFALDVPVVHGVVTLPTVGDFTVSVDDSVDFVRITRTGSRCEVGFAGERLAEWGDDSFQAVRVCRTEYAGARLEVVFDDRDPHRVFVDSPSVPDPLSDVEFKDWCGQLDRAWTVLVNWDPEYAAELSAGLTSLVPLTREGRLVGASSSAAFGSIALSEKSSPDELADALVHELQHSKLNAVFEAVALHESGNDRFYAPWRDDPRPLNGVLHGIYAFTGVVEFWSARRGLVPEDQRAEADFAFVLRALQVRSAIEEIGATAALNEWGVLFLETLSRRLAACELELTAADRTGPVARIVDDRRALWRVKHVEPDKADVAALADAWSADRSAAVEVRSTIADHMVCAFSDRVPLLKAMALGQAVDPGGIDAADLAFVRGDVEEAAAGYRARLAVNADDEQAWAGLTAALGAADVAEVAVALHRELVGSDPVDLVGWLVAGRS